MSKLQKAIPGKSSALWLSILTHAVLFLLTAFIVNGAIEEGNKGELTDSFIIMAYSGPPLEEVSLERYQEVANSGVDILVPGNGSFNLEQNLKALDFAHQVGIKIIPIDLRMQPFALKPSIDMDETEIRQLARDYREHPALGGYFVRDEPSASMFPRLRAITDVLRAEDSVHEPIINLFPIYGTIHQFGVVDYSSYIRDYLEIVKPKWLAYDSYPLRTDGVTIYDDWYANLEIVRAETLKAKIPFLVFLQSEGIKGGLRVPNRKEILWQASTVLAYGAQGVGWFTYWTPTPDLGLTQTEGASAPLVESHNNGMIALDGTRTVMYDYVSEANRYLHKAGQGVLGWDNIAIARYRAGKREAGSSPAVTPTGVDADIIIGTFRQAGKIRLVIANASCEKAVNFSLIVSDKWTSAEVFASVEAQPDGASLLDWSFEPGGSILLDLK